MNALKVIDLCILIIKSKIHELPLTRWGLHTSESLLDSIHDNIWQLLQYVFSMFTLLLTHTKTEISTNKNCG